MTAGTISVAAVTGANGFIGQTLCRLLLKKGYETRALVRPGREWQFEGATAPALNLADVSALTREFSGCEVVLQLAG